jgi:hypothetical protein
MVNNSLHAACHARHALHYMKPNALYPPQNEMRMLSLHRKYGHSIRTTFASKPVHRTCVKWPVTPPLHAAMIAAPVLGSLFVAAYASRSEHPFHLRSTQALTAPPPHESVAADGPPLYQFSPTCEGLGLRNVAN